MNKVIILFLFMLVLTSTFTGYGLWFQNLRSNIVVKTGNISWKINTSSTYMLQDCECRCKNFHHLEQGETILSSDNRSLSIYLNLDNYHCHHRNITLWVGIIILNSGNIPIRINDINITVIGDYSVLNNEYYMYGPYSLDDPQNIYDLDDVDPSDLPMPGSAESIMLGSNMYGVIWLSINIDIEDRELLIIVEPIVLPWNLG